MINIYSDEVFQEIDVSTLQPSKVLFFNNEKSIPFYFLLIILIKKLVNEHYSCALINEDSQGSIILFKIFQKNKRANRRNKLLRGHL